MPEGQKIPISKGPESFTKNFPSTFLVLPGEHYVFRIHLDPRWEAHPGLRKADEMSVKLKAIYEVTPTSESKEYKVWTGRVESRTYDLTLWQR